MGWLRVKTGAVRRGDVFYGPYAGGMLALTVLTTLESHDAFRLELSGQGLVATGSLFTDPLDPMALPPGWRWLRNGRDMAKPPQKRARKPLRRANRSGASGGK